MSNSAITEPGFDSLLEKNVTSTRYHPVIRLFFESDIIYPSVSIQEPKREISISDGNRVTGTVHMSLEVALDLTQKPADILMNKGYQEVKDVTVDSDLRKLLTIAHQKKFPSDTKAPGSSIWNFFFKRHI